MEVGGNKVIYGEVKCSKRKERELRGKSKMREGRRTEKKQGKVREN